MSDFPTPPNDPRRTPNGPFGGLPSEPSPPAPPPQSPPPPTPPGHVPPPGFGVPPGQVPPGQASSPGYGIPPGQLPPPGAPIGNPYGPPPKKSRKGCLWAVLGVVLLAVLGVGGCVFLVFQTVRGPVDATNDYFAAVVDNRPEDGIAILDPAEECFGENRAAEFADLRRSRPASYIFLTTSVETFNGQTTGVVTGTMTTGAGDYRVVVNLNKRGDNWLICGYRFS